MKTLVRAPFTAVTVVKNGRVMNGGQYLGLARKIAGDCKGRLPGKEEYDLLKLTENWGLLPENVDHVVFPEAQYKNGFQNHFRLLVRRGSRWCEGSRAFNARFSPEYVTFIVSATTPPV
jgi:hypothetical protein